MKRKFGIVLTLGLLFGLLATASAAYGTQATVDIKDMPNTKAIKEAVEEALQTNEVVVVANSAAVAYEAGAQDLAIAIPGDRSLVWQADYSCAGSPDGYGPLVFAGPGSLELSDCTIVGSGKLTTLNRGGSGSLTLGANSYLVSDSIAIACQGNLTISGAQIISQSDAYALTCAKTFVMNDGVISAATNTAIYSNATNSDGATVSISGGLILVRSSETAGAFGTTSASVAGGHGTSTDLASSVIVMNFNEPVVSSGAVITVWNTPAGSGEYLQTLATDLTSQPANMSVWWIENGIAGIRYNASGFFAVDGITVTDPLLGSTGSGTAVERSNSGTVVSSSDAATTSAGGLIGGLSLMQVLLVVGTVVVALIVLVIALRIKRGAALAASVRADEAQAKDKAEEKTGLDFSAK